MKIDFCEEKEKLLLDGFIIIENLVSKEHVDFLHEKMLGESWEMMKEKKWGGVRSCHGHIQQNPPRYAPYVFRDIVSNPVVINISKLILGENFYNDFYSANTNCPESIMQPLHSDCMPLWPGNVIQHPPVSLVINIPLVDTDEINGSMEIWPGSHLVLGAQKYVDEKIFMERKKTAPPMRANMKKGSILIRDTRLWHRGMPNTSTTPRPMLAMMHHIHWLKRGKKLAFAAGCESDILDNQIDHHIYFTHEPIDHSIDPTQN